MIRKLFLNPKFIITEISLTIILSVLLFSLQEREGESSTYIHSFLALTSFLLLISLFFTLETIFLKIKTDRIRYLGSFFFT